MSTATTNATARVLIADKFQTSGIQGLEAAGCHVTSQPDLTPDSFAAALAELSPDIIVVRSTKVPAPVIAAASNVSLIVRAGAGYDNIDVAAASERGIFVANCPGKNAIAVAELAMGLILSCDRRLTDQQQALLAGTWDKKGFGKARGLYGRTLGVVGLGRIGEEVVRRGKAFGMNVIAWSRSLTPERADELGITHASSPMVVAEAADVVSLHVALTPETRHLVNAEFLAAMKDNAILINTARGGVVDEAALARELSSKRLRAGLDVYETQPAPTDSTFANPIIHAGGVCGTHHCGASTDQAQEAIAAETVRIIKTYLESGTVLNCVNRAAASPATCVLTVRHLNRAGVLTQIFRVISEAGINVEEMENLIYDGGAAACARIQLDDEPNTAQRDAIAAGPNILGVAVTPLARN